MGQRIHWKQYGLIVTIAGAPWLGLHGQNVQVIAKKNFFHIVTTYEKLVVNDFFFLLYIHVCLHLWYSWIWRTSARIMLQGHRNILRTFHHRVDTCTRMTNEQLIFHIYGSHCDIYIYIYTPPSESFRTKLSSSGNITRTMFWSPYIFFVWADYLDILQYLTTIY